jgi:hypothetical protein
MKAKIVCILVVMLLITTALPVIGTLNINVTRNNINKNSIKEVYATISGIINDFEVIGNGDIIMDNSTGGVVASAMFDTIPQDVNPLIWQSFMCMVCFILMPCSGGAVNLYYITGGNFDGTSTFNIYFEEELVGEIVSDVILIAETPDVYYADIILSGWYNGPTDAIGTPGYNCLLQQTNPGEITGTYSHNIQLSDPDKFVTCEVTRIYQYDTSNVLPFDEIAKFTFESIEYVDQQLTFSGYGIYEPLADLDCDGNLIWSDVEPGDTVEDTFIVKNIGASGTHLDWHIKSFPGWGTWNFSPLSGTGLKAGESVNVEVDCTAPDEVNENFIGEIVVVNSYDYTDSDTVSVTLNTPRSRTMFNHIISGFLGRFPILKILLQRLG